MPTVKDPVHWLAMHVRILLRTIGALEIQVHTLNACNIAITSIDMHVIANELEILLVGKMCTTDPPFRSLTP